MPETPAHLLLAVDTGDDLRTVTPERALVRTAARLVLGPQPAPVAGVRVRLGACGSGVVGFGP